jgi:hypothetical protein
MTNIESILSLVNAAPFPFAKGMAMLDHGDCGRVRALAKIGAKHVSNDFAAASALYYVHSDFCLRFSVCCCAVAQRRLPLS